MFPILMSDEEWEKVNAYKLSEYKLPKELPIKFVNQYKRQIEKNYNKTIEELIEKGGLHPRELCAAMYGMPLRTYFGKIQEQLSHEQTAFAANMIVMKLYDFEKK